MSNRFASIPSTDAAGIGASLLATVARVSAPPADARRLALQVAPVVPALTTDAQAAQDALMASLGSRDGAVSTRGGGVQRAVDTEKELDRMVSALHGRLESSAKGRMVGAAELFAYLFPDGVKGLTKLTGRPQRAQYDRWVASWSERPKQGSPADLDIALAMAAVGDAVRAFGAVLDGKDNRSRAADGAIEDAGTTRGAWNVAFLDLATAIEVVQATAPAPFEDWLAPYLEWRRAQEARASRDAAAPPEAAGEGAESETASSN